MQVDIRLPVTSSCATNQQEWSEIDFDYKNTLTSVAETELDDPSINS